MRWMCEALADFTLNWLLAKILFKAHERWSSAGRRTREAVRTIAALAEICMLGRCCWWLVCVARLRGCQGLKPAPQNRRPRHRLWAASPRNPHGAEPAQKLYAVKPSQVKSTLLCLSWPKPNYFHCRWLLLLDQKSYNEMTNTCNIYKHLVPAFQVEANMLEKWQLNSTIPVVPLTQLHSFIHLITSIVFSFGCQTCSQTIIVRDFV